MMVLDAKGMLVTAGPEDVGRHCLISAIPGKTLGAAQTAGWLNGFDDVNVWSDCGGTVMPESVNMLGGISIDAY